MLCIAPDARLLRPASVSSVLILNSDRTKSFLQIESVADSK